MAEVTSLSTETGTDDHVPMAPTVRAAYQERFLLVVENMTCGGCMGKVERALQGVDGVVTARANLSARIVSVTTKTGAVTPLKLIDELARAGYRAADMAETPPDQAQTRERDLLVRIGVAGFAAANIMLLSVGVWAGMVSDMGPAAAQLFHWVSALIALPAVAYAGQPFFRSAYDAIKVRRLNMDVPISVAITLATGMSLFQTIRGSEQVYFDAAVTLLLFLLTGRFLDQRMRVRAAGAARGLMALTADWASVLQVDGSILDVPARALKPGMRLLVAAGARIPADGLIAKGFSDVDESLITGEPTQRSLKPGARVHAGTINLSGAIEVEATATDSNTLLAEISRLMIAAEQGRGRYVRLADRAARIYAPAVHLLGFGTFAGWLIMGATWQTALTAAIAVLIITCPCALALAVPAVQVAASSRLFARGLILKAADGLERLADIDTIVLDKTGTLTTGAPIPVDLDKCAPEILRRAAGLAAASRHPYAQALLRAATDRQGPIPVVPDIREYPGRGLSVMTGAGEERLGSAVFVGAEQSNETAGLWYATPGMYPISFVFKDQLRADAIPVVASLLAGGYRVELLSGDTPSRVSEVANQAGIANFAGGQSPLDKITRLAALKAEGKRVLMVGDGLNDAPAQAAGHASMSPSSAADITKTAADIIWQGAAFQPIADALSVARGSRRMALQNFAVAIAYNAVFVPLAVAGLVTPLIAAIAMSTSSIAVTLNALRLRNKKCSLKAAQR